MPEGRTLTERQLNRALLARQMLLERARGSIPKVLDRMGTLQAQYAPSMYIGLWSRIEGFEREQLDRALESRTVVQGTLMRATIHLVSKADYWPIAIGVRKGRREEWVNASHRKDYTASEMSAGARRLRRRLGDGTMSRKEVHELLGEDSVVTNGVNMWLDLVRVPPSGTWERRRADLYAATEAWLGSPPKKLDERAGIEHLVRRYLTGFGPAPTGDIANWAGLHPKRVHPVIDTMKLRPFQSESGEDLVDLPTFAGKLRPDSGQDPLSKYLYENLSGRTQKLVCASENGKLLRRCLAEDLNGLLERDGAGKDRLASPGRNFSPPGTPSRIFWKLWNFPVR